MPGKPGRIITFYSYKGGTGRTMALANVAWILASNGKRVLTVDWDLEAPGLHRYFRPFLLDQDLTSSPGLIDLVWDFAAATVAPIEKPAEAESGWHEDYADIMRYAIALRWNFRSPGRLDFIPSGRQSPAYAARVNSFNWQNFYDRLGGGAFLESVKARMRQEYDYVLIDSRTGVSDTSGICTVQMPDDLVACFTANHQSLEGAFAVASSVRRQWSEDRVRTAEGRIFPILMRAELGEMDKLALARNEAIEIFSDFLGFLPHERLQEYWGSVEITYIPWYAFEEVLAVFVDQPRTVNSLLGAFERVTGFLTSGDVARAYPPNGPARARVLGEYLRGGPSLISAIPQAESEEEDFSLPPDLLDISKAFEERQLIISVLGPPASGKTFFVNRLRAELPQRGWKCRPRPASKISVSAEGIEVTQLVPPFRRHNHTYFVADVSGESFTRGLEDSGRDELKGVSGRAYLASLAVANAYILLIRAEDLLDALGQDKTLRRILSEIDDVISTIAIAKRRLLSQPPEELIRKGISREEFRSAFKQTSRIREPLCILLSQADRLFEVSGDDFDVDPYAFLLRSAPWLMRAALNSFENLRVDFTSAFYGQDISGAPNYGQPQYGTLSNFLWIDSLLRPNYSGIGSLKRILQGDLPTRLGLDLRRRFDPEFGRLWGKH